MKASRTDVNLSSAGDEEKTRRLGYLLSSAAGGATNWGRHLRDLDPPDDRPSTLTMIKGIQISSIILIVVIIAARVLGDSPNPIYANFMQTKYLRNNSRQCCSLTARIMDHRNSNIPFLSKGGANRLLIYV